VKAVYYALIILPIPKYKGTPRLGPFSSYEEAWEAGLKLCEEYEKKYWSVGLNVQKVIVEP